MLANPMIDRNPNDMLVPMIPAISPALSNAVEAAELDTATTMHMMVTIVE
jgi:hypothetical protein